jgi:hypothetical protein
MSIAVSTVVMPSRRFAVMLSGFCLGVAGIGVVLTLAPSLHLSIAWRAGLALSLIAISVWASRTVIGRGKSLRIDISEHGQIAVTEDKTCSIQSGEPRSGQPLQQQDSAGTTVVKLLPDSTIWPHLLLLRLQAEDRRIRNVLILRDCMSAEDFRSLSVACRWIAAHNGQAKR